MAIGLGNAFARIDNKQAYIGLVKRAFCLRLHAPPEREWRRFLEPGRIDDPETEICNPAIAFAAITGHPGFIVDERKPPADQPVEECGLANIRPSDNCNRKAHRGATAPLMSSTIDRQIGVVGQDIKGVVGDHRRHVAACRQHFAAERLAGVRGNGDGIAG